MVLKCETYPVSGYQLQTSRMFQESDGYSQNCPYGGISGMPMAHTYSHSNYTHKPVFQSGHSEQQHHSGWETNPGYYGNGYNVAPSGTFTGGMPHSGGYPNHYPESKYGHMGAGNIIEKIEKTTKVYSSSGNDHSKYSHGGGHSNYSHGGGHSNYSHGSSAVPGHGDYQKSWTLKGLEDDE